MAADSSLLRLTAHLPEVEIQPGEHLVVEGDPGGAVWVLVEGELDVRRAGVLVNRVTRPGALIGEVSVLLDQPAGATVTASTPARLRQATNGRALLASDPAVGLVVATGLAERLHFVTAYLADLKHQYRDVPGLAMVDDVLRDLVAAPPATARPGSARDPDPAY